MRVGQQPLRDVLQNAGVKFHRCDIGQYSWIDGRTNGILFMFPVRPLPQNKEGVVGNWEVEAGASGSIF